MEAEHAVLLGVSFDTPQVNRAFAEENHLPFRMLSDADRAVGEIYQTSRRPEEPTPSFAKRRTYLIDPQGRIAKAYRVSDIAAHPEEVLSDLRALAGMS